PFTPSSFECECLVRGEPALEQEESRWQRANKSAENSKPDGRRDCNPFPANASQPLAVQKHIKSLFLALRAIINSPKKLMPFCSAPLFSDIKRAFLPC